MKESIQQYLLLHTKKNTLEICQYLHNGNRGSKNIEKTIQLLWELDYEGKIYVAKRSNSWYIWKLVDGVIIA